jgi:hypothetical protein
MWGKMLIHFDVSSSEELRGILLARSDLFVESGPEEADAILFGRDELAYLRGHPLVRRFRSKCLCVSETDIPVFALPGLYAANIASFLTAGRTETVSYFVSQHATGNEAVRRLQGQAVEKRYLYSFLGGSHSWPRKRLFRMATPEDVIVEPTHDYVHWDPEAPDLAEARARSRDRYAEILAASKFALCPRGCGLSSFRLFEAMSLGVAPVIIADGWRPVSGLDWSFALFVPEAKIPRIDAIVRAHEPEWAERGALARAAYQQLFAPEQSAAMAHERLTRLLAAYDPLREAALAPLLAGRARLRQAYWDGFVAAKKVVLQVCQAMRLPSPVVLRHSIDDQVAYHKAQR